MNFISDNIAGASPKVMAAIAAANDGPASAYGTDGWTQAAERRIAEIFEREFAVFLVTSGTAANALALASLNRPWGAVITHDESHDYIYNGAAHFSAGHHPFLAEALQLLALRTERFGEHDAAAVTGPLLYQTTWDAVPAIFRPARISSRTVFLFDWWDRNSQRPCAWIDPGFAASWDGGPPEFWQGS
jgi:hypothetical protein